MVNKSCSLANFQFNLVRWFKGFPMKIALGFQNKHFFWQKKCINVLKRKIYFHILYNKCFTLKGTVIYKIVPILQFLIYDRLVKMQPVICNYVPFNEKSAITTALYTKFGFPYNTMLEIVDFWIKIHLQRPLCFIIIKHYLGPFYFIQLNTWKIAISKI